MKGGRLVDDLVETDGGEIGELHLDDRPHSLDGSANREAHHCILADWRINDPPGELLRQVPGGFERTAERAHVLSVNEHARVLRQRARLSFPDGIEVSNAHSAPSLKCAEARAHQFSA